MNIASNQWAGPRRAGLALLGVLALLNPTRGGEPPRVVHHVVVDRAPSRFAGWPANHGIWSWGDEILVGFSRGTYKDLGSSHHIDREKPEYHLLARSLDGGLTWSVEAPRPHGVLVGAPGMRHGTFPPDAAPEVPRDLTEPIDFERPGFAMTLRMESSDHGTSRFYYSYDRGHRWNGPYRLPLFGQPGVMARTDYVVNGPRDCHVFLTAAKSNGHEGRPFAARTTDGGLTWRFLGMIGPEPARYAIMPSTVRIGPDHLVTTIRWRDARASGIDAYATHDNGTTWSRLAAAEPDAGEGNPPSLLRLPDGRLVVTYGYRAPPFGLRARFSADDGQTWSAPFVLRDDAGGRDLGYVRSARRADGKIVSLYYYHDRPPAPPERYLAATIWDPGTR